MRRSQRSSLLRCFVCPCRPRYCFNRPSRQPLGTDQEAGTGPPLPFNSSLSSLARCCWGGQSMLCLRYLSWGMFLRTSCNPVKPQELRAINARPRLASARASASFGSVASAVIVAIMSV